MFFKNLLNSILFFIFKKMFLNFADSFSMIYLSQLQTFSFLIQNNALKYVQNFRNIFGLQFIRFSYFETIFLSLRLQDSFYIWEMPMNNSWKCKNQDIYENSVFYRMFFYKQGKKMLIPLSTTWNLFPITRNL